MRLRRLRQPICDPHEVEHGGDQNVHQTGLDIADVAEVTHISDPHALGNAVFNPCAVCIKRLACLRLLPIPCSVERFVVRPFMHQQRAWPLCCVQILFAHRLCSTGKPDCYRRTILVALVRLPDMAVLRAGCLFGAPIQHKVQSDKAFVSLGSPSWFRSGRPWSLNSRSR